MWTSDPVRKGDIKEYRYFPEYDGYLPVVRGKELNEIQGDWLFLKDYPKTGDYALPQNPEGADRRIRERAHSERLRAAGMTPLCIVTLPITVPLTLIVEPIHHYYSEPKHWKAREERFRQAVGVEVAISVVDPQGKPIPDAMIREDHSLSEFLCCPLSYLDEKGHRSFRPPRYQPYAPKPDFYQLVARHVPIELGTMMRCAWGRGGQAGLKNHYAFDHVTDSAGRVRYTSSFYKRYAEYQSSQWRWKEPPPVVTYFFVVWAPGFGPVVRAVDGVQPGRNVELAVVLDPIPEHDRVSKVAREFLSLRDDFVKRCGSLKEDRLNEMITRLQVWAADESLPSYLRLNAAEFLKSVQQYSWADLTGVLEDLEGTAASLSVFLEEGPRNPWRFKQEYLKWDTDLHRLCYGAYTSKAGTLSLTEEARRLLSMGEGIDPGIPQLETLRAVIDLAEGRRLKAVVESRYMDHCEFFGLFYPDIVFDKEAGKNDN